MKVSLPLISICVMAFLLWSGCSSKEEPPPPKQTKVVKVIKKPPQTPPAAKEETAKPEITKPEPPKVEAPKVETPKIETPKAHPVETKLRKEEKKEPETKRAPTQEKAPVIQAGTKTEKKAAAAPEEGFYTVVKGDTLSGIAGKAEVYKDPLKWPILYRINVDALGSLKLSERLPDTELPTGTKLRIVTPDEVKENLGKLAAKTWIVNVLSATTNAEVVPAVINLAKNKYPVYITIVKVKEKDWMRVRVGYFKDKAEAEAEGKKIMTMLNFSDSWTTKLGQNEFTEFAGY